jgi:superfamily II DNA or RNA helicase
MNNINLVNEIQPEVAAEEIKNVVYFGKCNDLKHNFTKVGKTSNFIDRKGKLQTSYPLSQFKPTMLIICDNNEEHEIEELIHSEYIEHNSINRTDYYGTSTEWFEYEFNHEEIKKILVENNYNNKILVGNDLTEYIDKLDRKIYINKKEYIARMELLKKKRNQPNDEWLKREYQEKIIKYAINYILQNKKFYLELPTGAGKSYIIYKIFSILKTKNIIIFSPRIKINSQNTLQKYVKLLNNDYLVYNLSKSKINFEKFKQECETKNKKMIIVACPQASNQKVHDIIKNNNLNEISIWFDESHHTVQNWTKKIEENNIIKFFLQDDKLIINRLFTSASPDKEIIEKNTTIFGELYKPITVKELINLKWLCPIIPMILEKNISLELNLSDWILDTFREKKRKWGFSFHNRDNNAFDLFYLHYDKYMKKKTDIKPYLLINNDGLNDSNKKKLKNLKNRYCSGDYVEAKINGSLYYKGKIDHVNDDNTYNIKFGKNIIKNIKNCAIKNDFQSINSYELRSNSIGYIVKQYSIGYDFNNLDYIVISDPKFGYEDIIQSIGRGIRPDKKGEHGKNLNKKLLLMLPIFIDDDDKTKYKNIIEVLRYLILDLEVDIEKILIQNKSNNNYNNSTEYKNNYNGIKKSKSKLLDLLYQSKILNRPIKTKTLVKFCKKYDIQTEQDYYKFKDLHPELKLLDNLYEYPAFYWKMIVDPVGKKYYKSLSECKNSRDKIYNNLNEKYKNNSEKFKIICDDLECYGWKEFHKYDNKIPPYSDIENKFYPKL